MGVLDDVEKLERSDARIGTTLLNIEKNQQKIIGLLEEILKELKTKK